MLMVLLDSFVLVLVLLALLVIVAPLVLAVMVLRWAWREWHQSEAGDQRQALVVGVVILLAAIGYFILGYRAPYF
jgi:membrane protease YdiL (CAAX protease family)